MENKSRRMRNKNALFFRNLSHPVKTMFKSVCTRREQTMQAVVEALMRLYVKAPECVEKELKEVKRSRAKL